MKGYIIKDGDKYYRGSVRGSYRFSGFFEVKIYRSYKWALKALRRVKRAWNNFSIYEVEVTVNNKDEEE